MQRIISKDGMRVSENRKVPFVVGEFYHIYNRGVDKRSIFTDESDLKRFFQSMSEFNTADPIGSIFEHQYVHSPDSLGSSTPKSPVESDKSEKLVSFVAYCLNPNHYHFALTPLCERGIERFMQRLGTGYTNYFNERYERSGSLFQGRYKSVHVETNKQLLHLSVYINLNNRIGITDDEGLSLGSSTPKSKIISKSSWEEFNGESNEKFCEGKGVVVDQFENVTDYKDFALFSFEGIKTRKEEDKKFKLFLGNSTLGS